MGRLNKVQCPICSKKAKVRGAGGYRVCPSCAVIHGTKPPPRPRSQITIEDLPGAQKGKIPYCRVCEGHTQFQVSFSNTPSGRGFASIHPHGEASAIHFAPDNSKTIKHVICNVCSSEMHLPASYLLEMRDKAKRQGEEWDKKYGHWGKPLPTFAEKATEALIFFGLCFLALLVFIWLFSDS